MEIEVANREFYDRLYRKKSRFSQLLLPRISFDQQSKSKRNYLLLLPHLRKVVRRAPKILDYGFGHGSFLLKLPPACEAYGCDISPEAVLGLESVARMQGRRMNLSTVDGFETATCGIEFDFIICSHVLEHVPDDSALLGMFASRLASGGRIIVNLPINEVWRDPKHVRDYDRASIERLLGTCGLAAEEWWICDRWTALLLTYEQARRSGLPLRLALRLLRALLAVLPLRFVDLLERALPAGFKEQQILFVAGRR